MRIGAPIQGSTQWLHLPSRLVHHCCSQGTPSLWPSIANKMLRNRATPSGWRKIPPSERHENAKDAVREREHPGRSHVEQGPPNPVLDEPTGVAGITRTGTKLGLERCEWAGHSQPRLKDYHADGGDMQKSEAKRVDEAPASDVADDDGRKRSNDEQGDAGVGNEDQVSQESRHGAGAGWRSR